MGKFDLSQLAIAIHLYNLFKSVVYICCTL